MLLIELQVRKVPCLTIFPYAERDRPDTHAAAKAIEILNKQFNLSIPVDKLQEEPEDMEEEVSQILKQQDKEKQQHSFYT